jgi:hypothetical protein
LAACLTHLVSRETRSARPPWERARRAAWSRRHSSRLGPLRSSLLSQRPEPHRFAGATSARGHPPRPNNAVPMANPLAVSQSRVGHLAARCEVDVAAWSPAASEGAKRHDHRVRARSESARRSIVDSQWPPECLGSLASSVAAVSCCRGRPFEPCASRFVGGRNSPTPAAPSVPLVWRTPPRRGLMAALPRRCCSLVAQSATADPAGSRTRRGMAKVPWKREPGPARDAGLP